MLRNYLISKELPKQNRRVCGPPTDKFDDGMTDLVYFRSYFFM